MKYESEVYLFIRCMEVASVAIANRNQACFLSESSFADQQEKLYSIAFLFYEIKKFLHWKRSDLGLIALKPCQEMPNMDKRHFIAAAKLNKKL